MLLRRALTHDLWFNFNEQLGCISIFTITKASCEASLMTRWRLGNAPQRVHQDQVVSMKTWVLFGAGVILTLGQLMPAYATCEDETICWTDSSGRHCVTLKNKCQAIPPLVQQSEGATYSFQLNNLSEAELQAVLKLLGIQGVDPRKLRQNAQ
jgi:hypothetical protein